MKLFLIFIIEMALFGFLMEKMENQKTYRPENSFGGEFDRRISEEKSLKFRMLYFDLFRNRNINTVMNSVSDLLFQTLKMEINNLNQLGLRREIRFFPKKEKERDESLTVSNFGKFSVTEEKLTGNYQEILIDTATDTVMWKREFPRASLKMILSRNPEQKGHKEFYCQGCGSLIELEGELFICIHCGAKYSADAYDWILSDLKLENDGVRGGTTGEKTDDMKRVDKGQKIGRLIGYMILPAFLASIFFRGSKLISTVSCTGMYVMIVAGFVSAVLYIYAILQYRRLIRFDRMSSPQRVNERAGYLLKRLMLTYQNAPNKMKAFMDEAFFATWRNSIETEEDRLIFSETDLSHITIKKFWIKNGRQHVKLEIATFNLYLTPERRVKESTRNFGVVLYRHQEVFYKNIFDIESVYCKGCGMPMDLSDDGQCKYCGTEYDLADYDWKIEILYDVGEENAKKITQWINGINEFFSKRKETV
ncbi:MAG: hypothetical protein JXO44_03825 [Clostridia bacterium]|nr:hypothetical protein [Clostridia bacterium]